MGSIMGRGAERPAAHTQQKFTQVTPLRVIPHSTVIFLVLFCILPCLAKEIFRSSWVSETNNEISGKRAIKYIDS